jgi:hypothetical protein
MTVVRSGTFLSFVRGFACSPGRANAQNHEPIMECLAAAGKLHFTERDFALAIVKFVNIFSESYVQ